MFSRLMTLLKELLAVLYDDSLYKQRQHCRHCGGGTCIGLCGRTQDKPSAKE